MQKSSIQNYWSIIWARFKKNRGAKWAYRALVVLLWIVFLNPFIAGDVPIYCKIKGVSSFPIFKSYLIDLGLAKKTGVFLTGDYWHEVEYEQVIKPIIPYSNTYRDRDNIHFKNPFGPQNLSKNQAWHWMGTDGLGRDVAAAIIQGFRTAMKVGLMSMLIATIIGLFLGGLAGYFGDNQLVLPIRTVLINLLALFFAIHFAFISRAYQLSFKGADGELLKSLGIFGLIFLVFNGLDRFLKFIPILKKKVKIPLDLLIMRLIEVLNAIPGLLLIIGFIAIFSPSTLWPLIIIMGLLRWTGIARFFRAELLKVRNMEFIQASKALGYSHWRILFKHALPNAIGPVTIIIAFGIAGVILTEAALTFLGIGTSNLTEVTWGTLLRERNAVKNWWMVVFPGFAIFITVLIFNLIGEGLKDALGNKDI